MKTEVSVYKKYKRAFMLAFLFVLLLCICQYFAEGKLEDVQDSATKVDSPFRGTPKQKMIKDAQECYKNHFIYFKPHQTRWFEISDGFNVCSKDILNYIPYMETTAATVERKYYMMPRTPYIHDPCSVITFGIGGDIDSEKHIKMMLPQCSFLGFDPNAVYKHLFQNILGGKFVKAGVSSSKKGQNTILQLDASNIFQKVKESNLKSAAELIASNHGVDNLIDILNIDIEGFEYSIIEDLIKNKIYQNACQINIEIHPVWLHNIGYSYQDVMQMFIDIAKDGTFLWAKMASNKNITYCIYFVNVKNPKCIEKYLKDRLL